LRYLGSESSGSEHRNYAPSGLTESGWLAVSDMDSFMKHKYFIFTDRGDWHMEVILFLRLSRGLGPKVRLSFLVGKVMSSFFLAPFLHLLS